MGLAELRQLFSITVQVFDSVSGVMRDPQFPIVRLDVHLATAAYGFLHKQKSISFVMTAQEVARRAALAEQGTAASLAFLDCPPAVGENRYVLTESIHF